MRYVSYFESPLGKMMMASDGSALTGLWFCGCRDTPEEWKIRSPNTEEEASRLPVFLETVRWLRLYFSGQEPNFTPRLRPGGSAFRRMVEKIMLTIPYGKTMSYGEIAKEIVKRSGTTRMAAQAVGGAVRHNPISIIIPCHRVIGSNGNLTGYGGGMERKVKLLQLEGIDLQESSLFLPQAKTESTE